jgi:hypothetical protein
MNSGDWQPWQIEHCRGRGFSTDCERRRPPPPLGSVSGSLEDVGDQPGEASPFLVCPLLVELPVGCEGEGDPLWAPWAPAQ